MATSSIRILAICSEQDVLTTLTAAMPGAVIFTACTGASGFELARAEDPDVILLGIALPDSIELCRQIKTDEGLHATPVLMLTAPQTDRTMRRAALAAGADGFLATPLDEQDLVAQIRVMTRLKAADRVRRQKRPVAAAAERTLTLEQELAERAQLQDILREREARLKTAEHVARVGHYEIDIATGTAFWSEETFRIFGLSPGSPPPTVESYAQLIHPDDRAQLFQMFARAVNAAEPFDLEYAIVHTSGEIRYVHSLGSVMQDAQGQRKMFGTLQDITARRRAEAALQNREAQVKRQNEVLLQLMQSGAIFRADLHAALDEITEACASVTGVERVSVWRYNADHSVIRCLALFERSSGRHSAGQELRSADFPSYKQIHMQGKVIAAVDVRTDPKTREIPAAYWDAHNICSLVDAPVWLHGVMGGIVSFEHVGEPRTWTSEDERFCSMMATLVSLCFESAERRRAETALRESEDRFRRMAQDMPALICTFLPDSTLTYVNQSYCEFFQKPPEALWGQRFVDLLPDEAERHAVMAQYLAMTPAAPIKTYEHRVIKADGSLHWQRWTDRAFFDEQGQVTQFQSIGLDITERKLAETALQESEERYRLLLELAPIGIAVHIGNRIVFANSFAAQLLGAASPAQLIGKPVAEIIHPDRWQAARARLPRLLAGEKGLYPVEDVYLRLDGSSIDVEVIATPLLFQGETAIQTIIRDISERKRAEAERARLLAQVQAQVQQTTQIIDSVPEGVLLLDEDGRVLLANPTGVRDLAALANAAKGDRLTRLGDLPLADLLAATPIGPWQEVRAGQRIFEVIARPVVPGRPDVATGHWVVVIDDVTYGRAVRDQLQQQERLAAVGQLAAGIAHDFNNILAIIALQATMAAHSPDLTARDRARLAVIEEQTASATALIQQILDFSRRAVLERKPLDLAPLVQEQFKLLAHTLPENIQVSLVCEPDEYVVLADPTRIQQMIMNLAVNARDAMPHGGMLQISLSRQQSPPQPTLPAGPWVRLTIADSGQGIASEAMAHIFEPFYTTKPRGQGTGLGLAQVYGIVKQHNGEIEVHSVAGHGAAFTVYLPIVALAAPVVAAPVAKPIQGDGATILLVEDNAVLLEAMSDVVTMLGYTVIEARNGSKALTLLQDSQCAIDLVLTDLIMPEMGGAELLAAMHQQGLTTPVVILSGHPIEGELDELKRLGLAGWLLKPPDLTELAQVLMQAMARSA